MPRKPNPDGPTWNFYVDSSSGLPYVKASYNVWKSKIKKPRIGKKVHVGRLRDDQSVNPGKTFLEKFPEFAGKELFYFENHLYDREGYLQANPDAEAEETELNRPARTTPEDVFEEDFRAPSLEAGRTMVVWNALTTSGMLDDLISVLGKEDGNQLAALAVYLLCEPEGSMQNFALWLGRVYLPGIKPLPGQRITELLARVTEAKIQRYFKRRFDALLAQAKERRKHEAAQDPNAENRALTVAFDSTNITTYSETITEAEYGQSKSGEDLKQVNLTLACDQYTGEALFAHHYAGSINDQASLPIILDRMLEAGLKFNEIELVTDRGYKSAGNIQKQLEAGLKFVTGCPITEGALKKSFDKHLSELRSSAHWAPEFDCSALAVRDSDPWKVGNGSVEVWTHLYYMDDKVLEQKRVLVAAVDEILRAKNEGLKVSDDRWSKYHKCVTDIGPRGQPKWVRNQEEISRRLQYAGCFAIKTNAYPNPLDALTVYRQRNKIEALYRVFKADCGGNRLNAAEAGYEGKIFTFILAASARCLLSKTLRRICAEKNIRVPGNSLDTVLGELAKVTMHRGMTTLRWLPDFITKKQRDYLALLDVKPLKRRWYSW